MKPAVVTPTYNERTNLERLVTEVQTHLPGCTLIIVDDGSPDGTGDLADALAASRGGIRVIHRAGKLGLGSAYREGMGLALDLGLDPIFQMDADLSHDPADLPRLAARLDEGADLVLGSRWVEGGGTRRWPLRRRLISRSGTTYARICLGLPHHDLTGGFKGWRAACLGAIDLGAVRSEGYVFQVETTWRASRRGFRVAEVPIVFTERESGVSKMSADIAVEAAWRVPALRLRS